MKGLIDRFLRSWLIVLVPALTVTINELIVAALINCNVVLVNYHALGLFYVVNEGVGMFLFGALYVWKLRTAAAAKTKGKSTDPREQFSIVFVAIICLPLLTRVFLPSGSWNLADPSYTSHYSAELNIGADRLYHLPSDSLFAGMFLSLVAGGYKSKFRKRQKAKSNERAEDSNNMCL